MPKINLESLPVRTGSTYPAPFDREVIGRSSLRVGDAGGLTQFGANIVTLAPGSKSSMRHWHVTEDEFVMMIAGECTLIEDGGPTVMRAGDCATFKAGDENGHHFINETETDAQFLVVGTSNPNEIAYYSDFDVKVELHDKGASFTKRDGSPLDGEEQ
ncbi:MAG: cupin domain-containing protein [Paracoccaceae bacterium]|nr:cupin domain-containing protein [Paracoccaceae bacterium]MDG1738340.1 cupin domain-containing protein [Paracoccaceae bacterium]MDG2258895.1 cupin domain-containing protein [Paracoccaceae bacterium]